LILPLLVAIGCYVLIKKCFEVTLVLNKGPKKYASD
jgi:hypothetical protein